MKDHKDKPVLQGLCNESYFSARGNIYFLLLGCRATAGKYRRLWILVVSIAELLWILDLPPISFLHGNINMASMFMAPTSSFLSSKRISSGRRQPDCMPRQYNVITMRVEKPLEELYNVRVERQVSPKRLDELGVSRWSTWKTGKCRLPWDWHVDQLVYIEAGEVRVVPDGSKRYMQFVAGDLIRYPKWFEADLWFNGPYQERYSFRAYGDD